MATNKWAVVHILYKEDEPMTANTSIAKFRSNIHALTYAKVQANRSKLHIVKVVCTCGDVLQLPPG